MNSQVGGDGVSVAASEEVYLAELPPSDRLMCFRDAGLVPKLKSNLHVDAGLLSCPNRLERTGHVDGDRFLNEDALAGGSTALDQVHVLVTRSCN